MPVVGKKIRLPRIGNIRADALHKLTTELVRSYDVIGIEDLNVRGMVRSRRLSRHIMDQSFYETRRQLEYKGQRYGSRIVVAERFFASSKLCSNCGRKHEELSLSLREWRCSYCDVLHDRDVNAALNLRNMAVSSTVSACGAEGAGILA